MAESDFNLPPQCINCTVLQDCVTKFYEQVDHYANTALQKGIREERAARAEGSPPYAQTLKSIETKLLLEVATAIANKLHIALQREMNIIGLYCNGTDSPDTPQPQDCKSIASALE